jgi:HD-like signal output (HDOD) protein/prolyl-tRNA editing enzyme YbaK/EbsC (Cys-tRNA(Pro) deacylase)
MTNRDILKGISPVVVKAMKDVQPRMMLKASTVPDSRAIIATLMYDAEGMVQVLTPKGYMLDIEAIEESTGRKLRAVSRSEVERILGSHGISTIPGIPGVFGITTLVDFQVAAMRIVCVESGYTGKMIGFDGHKYLRLIENLTEGGYSMPLDEIEPINPRGASDEINDAVSRLTGNQVKATLEDTLDIPPLPESARKLLKLSSDPEAGVVDLCSIVELDPSLSAQLISWASSSFYSAPGKVKSLQDAISRVLGYDIAMNLSIGLSMEKVLNVPEEHPDNKSPYWHQAIWTAAAMSVVVKLIPPAHRPSPGMAYLAGLLHNFGSLIMAHVFPNQYSMVCRLIEANPHIEHSVLEGYILDLTREQLGSTLLEIWAMPEDITNAIRYQRCPNQLTAGNAMAKLLYVTKAVLHEYGAVVDTHVTIPESYYEDLRLDPMSVQEAIENMVESGEEIKNMIEAMSQ